MTRRNPLSFALMLTGTAAFLCAGAIKVSGQEMSIQPRASRAMLKHSLKRAGSRRLVKIKARAGDTLSLIGDRFGVEVEEIAALNETAASAPLRPGTELLIPLPSPEMLARVSDEKMAQHRSSGNLTGMNSIASIETEGAWENVQGVLFRKGSVSKGSAARSAESDRSLMVTGGESGRASKVSIDSTSARIVEVSEAERSTVQRPVWIHLIGGARVEADSINETSEGVWYKRGMLTIFIERARIERIEREGVENVTLETGSWKERGWTTGNLKFDALIKENGARYGVDPYLIFCVMEQESQFKPGVVSPKGARGLMQLMPGTAAHFGVRRVHDPAENIMGGTKYLKQLLENFNGSVELVLAGYNAGEGAVMKYGGRVPPYRETRNYVQRISKRYGQSHSMPAPSPTTSVSGLR
jgi:LysM repeat protein